MSGSLSEQTADVSGDYSAADDVTHLNCKIQHTHTPINTSQCQVNKLISTSKTAKKYSILILISIFTGWHFSANVSLDYNSQIFINCMIVLYEFQEMRNYWRSPKERGWLKMYLLLIEGEENHDTCDQIWVKTSKAWNFKYASIVSTFVF